MARRGERPANVSIGAQSDRLTPQLAIAQRKFRKFGRNVEKDVRKSFQGVRRAITGFAAIAGVTGVAQVARDTFEFEKSLFGLNRQANGNNKTLAGFREIIEDIGIGTGQGRQKVLEAAEAMVSLSGAGALTEKNLSAVARAATASGSDAADLAGIFFSLSETLKIKPEEMEQAFSAILSAGKTGAVQLKELSRELPGIAQGMSTMGMTGQEALAQVIAGLQVSRADFKGASETVNAMNKALIDVATRGKKLRGKGIKIFTDKTKTQRRDLRAIVGDLDRLGLLATKNADKLKKLFPSKESRGIIQALGRNIDKWDEWQAKAVGAKDVGEDFAETMESSFGRTSVAMARMQQTIAETFTPGRIKLFADAMESAARAVQTLADNWKTIAGIWVSAKVLGFLRALKAAGGVAAVAGAAKGALTGSAAGALAGGLSSAGVLAAGAGGFALGTAMDRRANFSGRIVGTRRLESIKTGDLQSADTVQGLIDRARRRAAVSDASTAALFLKQAEQLERRRTEALQQGKQEVGVNVRVINDPDALVRVEKEKQRQARSKR